MATSGSQFSLILGIEGHVKCGNYSREETIQGQKLFAEIRYIKSYKFLKNKFLKKYRFIGFIPALSKPKLATADKIKDLSPTYLFCF